MTTTRKSVLFTALLTVASLASSLQAQAGERSRSDVYGVGNSTIGIDFVGWARARSTSSERRVDTAAWSQLRFLGANAEMHRLAVTARRTSSSFSGSYAYRRLGITFRSGSLSSGGNRSFTHRLNLFPNDPSQTFWIAFVPVTVAGNIGFTGRMDVDYVDYAHNQTCMISGTTETYAYAWASAGVGVSGFQAGVRFELQLGRQKFDGLLGAFRTSLSTQYLSYEFTPLRLLLKAFAEAFWIRGELTIVDKSYGTRRRAPFIG